MSDRPAELRLPRGLFDEDGQAHRLASLQALPGHWERELADGGRLRTAQISVLLADSLARIGGFTEITPEHTALLSRGDRDTLLLALRSTLVGDAIGLVLTCPSPACGEQADLDLSTKELISVSEPAAEAVDIDTEAGPIRLREPLGIDDEMVEGLSPEAASAALWGRLILSVGGEAADERAWSSLSARARQQCALALHRARRGPELAIAAPCPACQAWMEVRMDAAVMLQQELTSMAGRLLAEVHSLAFHYHWSEAEILALPRVRRWQYLELLGRQLAGQPLYREHP